MWSTNENTNESRQKSLVSENGKKAEEIFFLQNQQKPFPSELCEEEKSCKTYSGLNLSFLFTLSLLRLYDVY